MYKMEGRIIVKYISVNDRKTGELLNHERISNKIFSKTKLIALLDEKNELEMKSDTVFKRDVLGKIDLVNITYYDKLIRDIKNVKFKIIWPKDYIIGYGTKACITSS